MHSLSEDQLLFALLALAVILVLARAMGELARRIGQPEVLGELFAGFLLGPSVFGALLPSVHAHLLLNPGVSLALSGFSWIGAILLLLIAGMEVDLIILRQHARPGAMAAIFAIVPSLIAGSAFAWLVLNRRPPSGVFLGIVLSVTAVSVAAKILMERGEMRRGYAQVILAAGVASEVVVWLFVAVVSSFHTSSPLLAGLIHTAYAGAFILLMMTVGRRFVFWAMRRVRDATWIIKGQVSLILALAFAAAALTQVLGLHALLGAFVVGVLLSQAPRKGEALEEGLQSLTLGLFGPIFFALAGMRVDILKLTSLSSIGIVLLLLVVATVVKVGLGTIGARLGGQSGWEAALVGVGLNLKGGTDVVVAVVGTELGLLSATAYTMYALVAIITVLFTPALMSYLKRKSPPSEEEQERLETEEAERRAYVPKIERVLVPLSKPLRGSLSTGVVEQIAASKHEHGQIFDITELNVQHESRTSQSTQAKNARRRLGDVGNLGTVELTEKTVAEEDVLERILDASRDYDLIAIGAHPPEPGTALSFGPLQDSIIDEAEADVLLAIDHHAARFDCASVHNILVPTNGLEYSMAAADIAGSLAESCGACVTVLHVAQPSTEEQFTGESLRQELKDSASGIIDELVFRMGRLGADVHQQVEVGKDPAREIVRYLDEGAYDLVVMGGVDRGHDGRVYLGHTIQRVLAERQMPAVLVIGHDNRPTS